MASIAAAITVLAVGRGAVAEDDPIKVAATTRLEEGARLYDGGDYAQALEKFEQAHRLVPSPKIFFNIGLAQSGLARYPEALRSFERFVGEATNVPEARLAEAHVQIENLKPKVAFIDVSCNAKDVEIIVDGRSQGKTPLRQTVYLEPGQHRLLAQASNLAAPIIQVFTAVGGNHQKLEVVVPPALSDPTRSGADRGRETGGMELRAEPPERPVYRRAWLWGAVGGVVVAAAVIGFLAANRSPRNPTPSLGTVPGP